MDVSEPFQLTVDDVKRASLGDADIGSWCVVVAGCYHLFGSEDQARFAYRKYLQGVLVR